MKSRVSHARRFAIVATQTDLDVQAAFKFKRTGPRYWSQVARLESKLHTMCGPDKRRAAQGSILLDELSELKSRLALAGIRLSEVRPAGGVR